MIVTPAASISVAPAASPASVVSPVVNPVASPTAGTIIRPTPATPISAAPPAINSTLTSAVPDTVKPNDSVAMTQGIALMLETWRQAWSAKDLNTYTAAYIAGYKGDSASSAAWKAGRERVFSSAGTIAVQFSKLDIQPQLNGDAQVKFTQTYRSNVFQETGLKTLLLKKEGLSYKIASETFVK